MIKPDRLLRIITTTEEDVHRGDMVWIFMKCYGLDYKQADKLFMEEWDKEVERISNEEPRIELLKSELFMLNHLNIFDKSPSEIQAIKDRILEVEKLIKELEVDEA